LFVSRVTNGIERALRAAGLSRNADLPPEVDHLVRKLDPAFLRELLLQIFLDLDRIVFAREIQPLGDAADVCINHNA
jgi:hypothetical protein